MAVQDIRSNLISQLMGNKVVVADTVASPFNGIIDTAVFELGVMFFIRVDSAGTSTSVTLVVQSSDDPAFGTFDIIAPGDENYIGSGLISDPITGVVTLTADATAILENRMVTAGVIANKRYLRPAITDVGGAGYILECFAIQKAEDMPVAEPTEAA